MKKIKSTIAIATLLAFFCSCGMTNTKDNASNDSSADTNKDNIVAQIDDCKNTVEDTPANNEDRFDRSRLPTTFEVIDGSSAKTILNAVYSERNSDEKEHHPDDRIEELNSFYSLDNLRLDGYELQSIAIVDALIGYSFFPIGGMDFESFSSAVGMGFGSKHFDIVIYRPDWERFFDFNRIVEAHKEAVAGYKEDIQRLQSEEITEFREYDIAKMEEIIRDYEEILNSRALLEERLWYGKGSRKIRAELGDTIFSISAPETLNLGEDEMYEFLRDLAFRVIESAELVTVG